MSTDNFLTCMEWKLQLGSRKNASLSVFCMTVVPRNVLTTKNRSDQSEGVSEDRQWLVTAPYGNRRDVPRGRPMPPGLSTGVQQHLLLRGQRTFLSGNNVADYQITRKGSRGLYQVCRICEICSHVNKKKLKKKSLLKIENFDFLNIGMECKNGLEQ